MNSEPTIQHKPSYLAHSFAFNEDGERVQIYRPPAPTLALELIDTLRESGATIPDVPAASEAIEKVFDLVGLERRVEELRWIINKVGRHSAAGEALHKLMSGEVNCLRVQSPKSKVARWFERHVNTNRKQRVYV